MWDASAESLAARKANRHARRSIDEVAADEGEQVWAFFCECGDSMCLALVELTLAAFDELVGQADARVLSQEHSMSHAPEPGTPGRHRPTRRTSRAEARI